MDKITYNEEDVIDHCGIAAVIHNEKYDVLMQKHVKYGFWTLPVGKVKEGQTITEGLAEEIYEECNIKIMSALELDKLKLLYERGGRDVVVDSYLFKIIHYEGSIHNNEPEKHSEQKFMGLEDIAKLVHVSDMTLLYMESMKWSRNHQYEGIILD